MESEIDYSKHSEVELVEMFGRMDPRYAPLECVRLGKRLTELGYIVTQGDTEPGFAEPSAAKLEGLIGAARPFECAVDFGKRPGAFRYIEPTHNDFGFVGPGKLLTDGMHLYLSGYARTGQAAALPHREIQLANRQIVNVESKGQFVRFEYGENYEVDAGAMTLKLADDATAAALVAVLPQANTKDFRPRIKANAEFEARLVARAPWAPVTFGLVAINTAVFIAMLFGGAEWFRPGGQAQIAWGSNFGPYTTEGEWWRLLTAEFIHFGLLHLFFNMVALVSFGPLVERLYGSLPYLLIYLLTGILGSLASISWHPAINSAGASGAIFGILGALLVASLRAGDRFPEDMARPIRRVAVIVVGWALYSGFRHEGVDNAAHLGGLASGFILGLVAAPLTGGEKLYSRRFILGLLPMIPTAAMLLAGGIWWAQRGAVSLAGDGLYYHTAHWLRRREPLVNAEFNSALRQDGRDHTALIPTLEKHVIPFWHAAADRLAAIELPARSPNDDVLDDLQDLADRREKAFQLLDAGLRKNDVQVIGAAGRELKQIDQMIAKRIRAGCAPPSCFR
jgi:rhomboid protease GluP